MAKRGLGKGLDALFIDNNTDNGSVTTLKVSEIEPNKSQPRKSFDEEALSELADSIRLHGVIQPLVVRPLEKGGYQIVAGERRWRASRRAGLSEVPVVIRDFSEEETLQIAIIENLQREDLTVVELARGYQALMDQYGMTQEQVAAKVGKSRSAVANTVRLLALPESVLEEVSSGRISQGHAKALLAVEDPEQIEELAQRVINLGLLVRDVEKLAREKKADPTLMVQKPKKERLPADNSWGNSYYREIELGLSTELGRRVRILERENKGVLELEFYTREELMEMVVRLSQDEAPSNEDAAQKERYGNAGY